MARTKTTTKKTAAPAKKKTVRALTPTDKTDLAEAARAALEAARTSFRETARGMYELGKALAVLRAPGMSEAAGHADFDALCAKEFELHPRTADRLVRAVGLVTAAAFAAMGPQRVNALLDLATATEADDTVAILSGEVVRLWDEGPRVDVARTPTEKIAEHARLVRARVRALGAGHGGDASPAERAAAEAAAKRLHHEGIAATVTARATKPGAPAEFDIVGLDLRELEVLTKG